MKKNYFYLSSLLLVSLTAIVTSALENEKLKACPDPYGKCNLGKDGMINVHLVPHTHDDVGWLKTVRNII
jgi:lysosomal alpha-mannosidase